MVLLASGSGSGILYSGGIDATPPATFARHIGLALREMPTMNRLLLPVAPVGLLLACVSSLSLSACMRDGASFPAIQQAVAVIRPTAGNKANGVVRFVESGGMVKITAVIGGLNPNASHALHVHEYGDCTAANGKSAGGHYNPESHEHGKPNEGRQHAGDLGNLAADADGNASYELTVSNITISSGRNPILGRAVIVHAKEDTFAQPTGKAGPRIGCGVIGVAKPSR